MEELLSKTPESAEPEDGAEFIELRLSDIGPDEQYPSFWVTETLYRWDAANKRTMRDDLQLYPFKTLEEARNWYEERRSVLVEQGFGYSDMDW
jgi:hypothetical protein